MSFPWTTLAGAILMTLTGLYLVFAISSPRTRATWDDYVTRCLGLIVGLGSRVLRKVRRWKSKQ